MSDTGLDKVRNDIRNLVIEHVGIDKPKPFKKNPRDHGKAHVDDVSRSIAAFGMNVPILCDENLEIIAGHATLLACKMLKMKEVPVVRLGHLSEAQKLAFRIAHNRLCEAGKWDVDLLAINFDLISQMDLGFSLEVTGFDTGAIDVVRMGGKAGVKAAAEAAKTAADIIGMPDESSPPVSRLNDRFSIGKHVIVCGDARDLEAYKYALGDDRADFAVCEVRMDARFSGMRRGWGRRSTRISSKGAT